MERVTIQQAAARLGVSPDTIRRRMLSGKLKAIREPRPQGFRWLVELPVDQRVEELERQLAAVRTERAALIAALEARTAEVERLRQLLASARERCLDAEIAQAPNQRQPAASPRAVVVSSRTDSGETSAGGPGLQGLRRWREERMARFTEMRQRWQEELRRYQRERERWETQRPGVCRPGQ
jgi:hypothetical protein